MPVGYAAGGGSLKQFYSPDQARGADGKFSSGSGGGRIKSNYDKAGRKKLPYQLVREAANRMRVSRKDKREARRVGKEIGLEGIDPADMARWRRMK